MEGFIQESTLMTKNMALESFVGLMEGDMKGIGPMENKKVLGFLRIRPEKKEKTSGKREKELKIWNFKV